jgi:hypothetical protein
MVAWAWAQEWEQEWALAWAQEWVGVDTGAWVETLVRWPTSEVARTLVTDVEADTGKCKEEGAQAQVQAAWECSASSHTEGSGFGECVRSRVVGTN